MSYICIYNLINHKQKQMKKTLFIISLFIISSCDKDCKYTKFELDKMMESEIKAAGSNWQKIDLIRQKYSFMYHDAC
jgi:hypothetical protein